MRIQSVFATIVTILALFSIVPQLHAAPVTFDFRGAAALYGSLTGQQTASVTVSGLDATFSTAVGDKMNRTTDGFGINAGISGDDTDGFDSGEFLEIVFGHNVEVQSITFSSWGAGNDNAQLLNNGSEFGTFATGGTHLVNNELIIQGNTLRINSTGTLVAGNGWSLDSLTVNTVPEPGALALLALGASALWRRRNNQRLNC